jgi:hypothetical protein
MSEAAVPVSRRSRVSPWGQPEVEANPSAGGQKRSMGQARTTAPKRSVGKEHGVWVGRARIARKLRW